jgi:DNA-binding response OmpR family regulator
MTKMMVTPPIPGARVLVADDELQVRSALVRSLDLLGYRADEAGSGYQALEMLEGTPYDVMVVDVCMPGMDGVEVMQRARQARPDLIIIVLTAYAALESAIAAVRFGAVDYLRKPASAYDIAAAAASALRQRAENLRRQHLLQVMSQALDELRGDRASGGLLPRRNQDHFLCIGPVTLDLEKCLAVVAKGDDAAGCTVELTASEAALLAYLMKYPGTVFSCYEMAHVALGYDVSEEEARSIVRPHVYRLRRKLETNPCEPRLIRTVHGRGYFFAS